MTDQEGEKPKFVISITDIQSTAKTQREREIEETLSEAQNMARTKMETSTSLGDFMRYHFATMVTTPRFSSWMFEDGSDIKPADVLEEFEDNKRKKRYEKEGNLAVEMRSRLDQIEDSSGIKIALARVRNDPRIGGWTYRVLAEFPKGEKAYDEVLDNSAARNTSVDYIFYEPQTACVQHACDVLYKANKKEGDDRAISILTTDYLTLAEAYDAVSIRDESGRSEFVLDTSLDGEVITQSPEKYIVAGIQNVFSNEWNRVRVSDFWNKTNAQN